MNTREQIVEAASHLIHIQGYRATTVDQVVEASGLSKGTLYHHFSNKESLARAVIDRFSAVYGGRFQEGMERQSDPLHRIGALMETIVDLQEESGLVGCPIGNLALELSCTHDNLRRRLQTMVEALAGQVEESLRQAEREGLVRAGLEAGRIARFLLAGVEGGVMLAKVTRDLGVLRDCVSEGKRYLESLRLPGGGSGRAT